MLTLRSFVAPAKHVHLPLRSGAAKASLTMAVHLSYCLSAGAQFGSLSSATCVSVDTDSLSCSPRVKKCTSACVACLLSVERVAINTQSRFFEIHDEENQEHSHMIV